MSEQTAIEWADKTFNPWIGCTKVSAGCANCYAESEDKRRGWTPEGWGKGKPRKRTTEAYWKQALRWERDAFTASSRAARTDLILTPDRPRVFPSLCDWLDDEVPIAWLADFLNLIRITPHLDWLLLTKRPENFRTRLRRAMMSIPGTEYGYDETIGMVSSWTEMMKAPRNVWLGVSVEDQDRAEQRIPRLIETPAAVRFLSCEPLLGPLNLTRIFATPSLTINALKPGLFTHTKIDWVIVGGESGPKARPCKLDWIREIVAQCVAAKVPVFVKQVGSRPIFDDARDSAELRTIHDHKGGNPAEWPADLRVREMPSLSAAAAT